MIQRQQQPVAPHVFEALQNVDIEQLSRCTELELRPILPCLVRMSLIAPLDLSQDCSDGRKGILTILSGIETVNSIVALLSIDFHNLEVDVKKEQQLRQKLGSSQHDSILGQWSHERLAQEFERSDSSDRLRLVLREILFALSQVQEHSQSSDFFIHHSDLFDNTVYEEEICDVLCIALAELPAILCMTEVADSLLHVRHGPWILCRLLANMPDCFREVCTALIANGEKQEEESVGGRIRLEALRMLCRMNPSRALAVRAKCVELCRMPALAVFLSLSSESAASSRESEMMKVEKEENSSDLIAFVSGLLLGNDQQVRNWFSLFVRNGQKRKWEASSALHLLRSELASHLRRLIQPQRSSLSEHQVVSASTLLRLYCALKGIAGLKLAEEEVELVVQLLTMSPPPTAAGVRFVSLGLCMLFACPSLVSGAENERRGVEWIRRLAGEEAYFHSSEMSSSFGEMLLLMAIHFHSNQLSAICDLVCSTLGMKVPVRPNSLTRMKQIFTQEIFTEQVVTAQAVRVPVTHNLNANIPGFLPVHCIYQLLKSRAFTKHRVPIKDWIYRQICSCKAPLHPVLPALMEVYVTSILVPSSKGNPEHTNEPITEEEIWTVFQGSVAAVAEGASFSCASSFSLPAQLLLLYYILLYEDQRCTVRSSSSSSSSTWMKRTKGYSQHLLNRLPIKHLLQQALKEQLSFAGLVPSLLRLLATHFPHLCLVLDWIHDADALVGQLSTPVGCRGMQLAPALQDAFEKVHTCPGMAAQLLRRLLSLPAVDVWPFASIIISHFKEILDPRLPRRLQELYKQVWLHLASVLPRHLWTASVSALLPYQHPNTATSIEDELTLDPLLVLRCDPRLFRCPPLLEVLLRIQAATLAACKSRLQRHQIQMATGSGANAGVAATSESEREELRVGLIAAQESAAVQILLEACLEDGQEELTRGELWTVQETRSVVCSYLHQVFISDPGLAKLVHFQGYEPQLLDVTVRGIPSMHICLDFIPELLSQPQLENQAFAVNLVSHLSVQYALPKAFSIARLALNTLSTLLGVLPGETRTNLFKATLPAIVRSCEAFPLMVEDVVSLLIQLGRVCNADQALDSTCGGQDPRVQLGAQVQRTFEAILYNMLSRRRIY